MHQRGNFLQNFLRKGYQTQAFQAALVTNQPDKLQVTKTFIFLADTRPTSVVHDGGEASDERCGLFPQRYSQQTGRFTVHGPAPGYGPPQVHNSVSRRSSVVG